MTGKELAAATAAVGLVYGSALGGVLVGVGPRGRAQINREVHDPRLYSNLRGIFESDKERGDAHKKLRRGKHTVFSAMREGFTRGGHRKEATMQAFVDELSKLGFVSDDEAKASLDQLDKLEANKLTPSQVGRYAAIGAIASPAVNVTKNVIRGGGQALVEGASRGHKLRTLAADAAGGAILTGAVPLARARLDQHAEMGKLRQYLAEREGA